MAIEVAEIQPEAVVAPAEIEAPAKGNTLDGNVTAFADMKCPNLGKTAVGGEKCVLPWQHNKVVYGASLVA